MTSVLEILGQLEQAHDRLYDLSVLRAQPGQYQTYVADYRSAQDAFVDASTDLQVALGHNAARAESIGQWARSCVQLGSCKSMAKQMDSEPYRRARRQSWVDTVENMDKRAPALASCK